MTHDGRWCYQKIFGQPAIARVMQLLEDGERLRVIARRLYLPPSVVDRLWKNYKKTGARSFKDDNPNAIPFSCIVVSS